MTRKNKTDAALEKLTAERDHWRRLAKDREQQQPDFLRVAHLQNEIVRLRADLAKRDAQLARRDDMIRAFDEPGDQGQNVTYFKNAIGNDYRVITPRGSYYRDTELADIMVCLDELSATSATMLAAAVMPPARAKATLRAMSGSLHHAWHRLKTALEAVSAVPDVNIELYVAVLEGAVHRALTTGDLAEYRTLVTRLNDTMPVRWYSAALGTAVAGRPPQAETERDAIRWAGQQVARMMDEDGRQLKECIEELKEMMDEPGFSWEWRDYLLERLGEDHTVTAKGINRAVKRLSEWRQMWLKETSTPPPPRPEP